MTSITSNIDIDQNYIDTNTESSERISMKEFNENFTEINQNIIEEIN